jgi:hypothetical protein
MTGTEKGDRASRAKKPGERDDIEDQNEAQGNEGERRGRTG